MQRAPSLSPSNRQRHRSPGWPFGMASTQMRLSTVLQAGAAVGGGVAVAWRQTEQAAGTGEGRGMQDEAWRHQPRHLRHPASSGTQRSTAAGAAPQQAQHPWVSLEAFDGPLRVHRVCKEAVDQRRRVLRLHQQPRRGALHDQLPVGVALRTQRNGEARPRWGRSRGEGSQRQQPRRGAQSTAERQLAASLHARNLLNATAPLYLSARGRPGRRWPPSEPTGSTARCAGRTASHGWGRPPARRQLCGRRGCL